MAQAKSTAKCRCMINVICVENGICTARGFFKEFDPIMGNYTQK